MFGGARRRATQLQIQIGKLIYNAMEFIKVDVPSLGGVLPKARSRLDVCRFGSAERREKDICGSGVYEYFLSRLVSTEGRVAEFCTPLSVVELIEPLAGRVYAGCCGSGGMFIQVERLVEAHGGSPRRHRVYGQHSTTPPVTTRWYQLRTVTSAP